MLSVCPGLMGALSGTECDPGDLEYSWTFGDSSYSYTWSGTCPDLASTAATAGMLRRFLEDGTATNAIEAKNVLCNDGEYLVALVDVSIATYSKLHSFVASFNREVGSIIF